MMDVIWRCSIAAMLVAGAYCGSEPRDQSEPAREVPGRVLTQADAGSTLRVEAGDQVMVRLGEAEGDRPWRIVSTGGLSTVGREDGEILTGDDGRVRTFLFQTAGVGDHELVFARSDADGGGEVHFQIVVR